MKITNMRNTTQNTRVAFPFSQAADRAAIAGVRGEFYARTGKALALKDVARFRSGRPLI